MNRAATSRPRLEPTHSPHKYVSGTGFLPVELLPISLSLSAMVVQVEIELEGGRRNQLKSQFHDRYATRITPSPQAHAADLLARLRSGDGSFQLFFFYGVQPTAIYIIIKAADGKYVGGQGPLRVKNPEIEQCYCPAPDPKDW